MAFGLRRPAFHTLLLAGALAAVAPFAALAQDAGLRFGGLNQDASQPVEVTSETFSVDQADSSALFTGNVVVIQGEMRLNAPRVRVEYGANGEGIQKVIAYDDVLLVTPAEAAEGKHAVYTVTDSLLVMTDQVVLTQGAAVITGDKLTANLHDSTGLMTGNVRTLFQPGAKQ